MIKAPVSVSDLIAIEMMILDYSMNNNKGRRIAFYRDKLCRFFQL